MLVPLSSLPDDKKYEVYINLMQTNKDENKKTKCVRNAQFWDEWDKARLKLFPDAKQIMVDV